MERKIGEIFTYNGKIYQVVKSDICANCAFRENDCSIIRSRIGLCVSSIRFDKTNVIFKEINNMEIKNNQLTIDIPEGMEIDLENSDLAKGIVRFKQSTITYEDVEDTLKLDKNCKSIIINESNASKLVTLSRLMNIAKYYNGDWKPNWSDPKQEYDVYVVWQCYILGNAKWLLSTTLPDGMYYEVTYNKIKDEFYLDAYKKFENRCIPNK